MNPAALSALANHLWQSTLIAGVAGSLTLALRNNYARVRHGLWLAASCKFLLPIFLLVALGGHIRWRTGPPTMPSNLAVVVTQVSQPFPISGVASPVLAKPAPAASPIPTFLLGIWGCGFLAIAGSWWVRWRRIKVAVRAGSPLRLELPVRAKSSPTLLEPGVFGIFRPVLVLPEGIFDRLTPAQLNAVVAHELCHVRHRDNLAAAIQMFVETIFWFHPLVWWIGKRMVEERERACDEEVLRLGSEPRVYAQAILKVCEFYQESRVACVAGVTGADLKGRVEAVMKNRISRDLNFGRKVLLAGAGSLTLAVPVLVGMMHAAPIRAQAQSAAQSAAGVTPKFEVASVKPCAAGESASGGGRGGGGGNSPTGRLTLNCRTVKSLIETAYASGMPLLPPIEGGPGWINSDRYTIEAIAEGSPSGDTLRHPMLQALLQDRFRLKTHLETREVSGYALTVAKGGPKLRPHQEGNCVDIGLVKALTTAPPPHAPGERVVICGASLPRKGGGPNVTLEVPGVSLDYFARTFLGIAFWGRPVINKTGIDGLFDIHLEFLPDESTPGPPGGSRPAVAADANGGLSAGDPISAFPSIFTALQQQLGLKLEPAKALREFLVIDHVERPSEN